MEEQIIHELKGKIETTKLEIEQLTFNLQVVKDNLNQETNNLKKYEHQLNGITNQGIHINLSDYFTKEELEDYQREPTMLFEPDIQWIHWLDWFYEELPFIRNKHITLTGLNSNKEYQINDIPFDAIVLTENNKIIVKLDEPVVINLNGINLFKMLSV